MIKTHNLIWEFESHNDNGETCTFSCSTPFNPEECDDEREAAIFFTFEEKNNLKDKGWHIGKPSGIRVHSVRKLSDVSL